MKILIPLTTVAMLALSSIAHAQTSAFSQPSGYVTVEINPGIFNLVGVSLHEPSLLSGVLDSATTTSVIDTSVDFTSLPDGVYILELDDDSGIIQEVTVVDSNTLRTSDDLSGNITGGTTAYTLRPAATLDSVFGADNSTANLTPSTDGSANGVDTILIQTSTGLSSYYFVDVGDLTGWFDGEAFAGDTVLNYADGIYVRTLADTTATSFIIAGQVKLEETGSILQPGFNFVNTVTPAGLTLGSSGLQDFIEPSIDGSRNGADLVLLPNPLRPGSFVTYYYVDTSGFTGWFDGEARADDVELNGAFFIRNLEGTVKPYRINGPTIDGSN